MKHSACTLAVMAGLTLCSFALAWANTGGRSDLPSLTSHCPGDITGDDHVGVDDLLVIIAAWGSSDPDADLNEDGIVGVDDLLIVIANYGPCPVGCVDGFNCGDDGDLFTCGSDGCFCMELSDGSYACLSVVESTCDAYEPCIDGECPPGYECVIYSCCTGAVCMPVCE